MKRISSIPSQETKREEIQQSIIRLDKKIQMVMKFSPSGKAKDDSLKALKKKKAKLSEELISLREMSQPY